MVERQHGMGFAAAKIGLQLHNRIAALTRQALYRADQHAVKTFGEIGAAEWFLYSSVPSPK